MGHGTKTSCDKIKENTLLWKIKKLLVTITLKILLCYAIEVNKPQQCSKLTILISPNLLPSFFFFNVWRHLMSLRVTSLGDIYLNSLEP